MKMDLAAPRALVLALALGWSSGWPAPLEAQDSGVELRPVDRATVRIVAVQGMLQATGLDGAPAIGLRAAHGSGVLVGEGGLIATAAHVSDDADYLVVLLPGADVGMPARVVHRSAAHDLAVLRVGGATARPIALARRARLELGQTVHVSGYPLDPRETWPAAVSGQIGRPLNDGRVQLSISVNPGNSGGPVITTDGALVGIVSQGADPQAGAQGIAIMEPIARLAEPLAALARDGAEMPPARSVVADLILERLTARPRPELDARVARLSAAETDEPMAAVLLAMEAIEVSRALLVRAGVQDATLLGEGVRASHTDVTERGRAWAARVGADAGLARRYGTLQALVAAPSGGGSAYAPGGLGLANASSSNASTVTGPATGPSPFAPAATHEEDYASAIHLGITGWGGVYFDDVPNQDAVGGGEGGAGVTFRLDLLNAHYFRTTLFLGADLALGGWRERFALSALGVVGLRMAVGPREVAGFAELGYTPGFATGEGRDDGVARAYRVGAGVKLGAIEITLTWRELGRWGNSTQRTLTLGVGVELDL